MEISRISLLKQMLVLIQFARLTLSSSATSAQMPFLQRSTTILSDSWVEKRLMWHWNALCSHIQNEGLIESISEFYAILQVKKVVQCHQTLVRSSQTLQLQCFHLCSRIQNHPKLGALNSHIRLYATSASVSPAAKPLTTFWYDKVSVPDSLRKLDKQGFSGQGSFF
uniref:Secreted protein n=1 Tax=Tanacetum cinerariifolium TaxID=118510 RepID=A0A699GM30_TANCI|nr:hypothetical protein [Tanacetum cinerariifolium]